MYGIIGNHIKQEEGNDMRHFSKRYKAKQKREAQALYKKAIKERIEENATFLGLSIQEYIKNETGEFDIW